MNAMFGGDLVDEFAIRPSKAAPETEAKPFSTRGQQQTTNGGQSTAKKLFIRGGKVVNDDCMFEADVYIEDGKIKELGANLSAPSGARVIEAKGQYVLPGGLDAHTHMQMPFMGARAVDDFYSGTKAALAGGTTTIIDFAIASGGLSPLDAYEKWRSWADGSACCDYGLHVAICGWDESGSTEKEMSALVREKGVNSFKCFMAYKDSLMLSDHQMIKMFDVCRRIGALPMVHAENGDAIDFMAKKLLRLGVTGPEGHLQSRPESVEAEATHRAITLADQVGAPLYVVHVMSNSAADEVVRAKRRGSVVFGEALAAGLGADGSHYFHSCWRHAAAHVLSPPLRSDPTTPENLMNLVSIGMLDTTGSDHCVFTSQQKEKGSDDFTKIPNGVNGVEERMAIVWEKGVRSGKMDPCRFVAATSSNAAKIFNLYPRKGRLAVGSDADVLVWGRKPKVISAETHHSLVDFNIFEGTKVEFGPLVVIAGGMVVLDEHGLQVQQGHGRYLSCSPWCNTVYGRITEREENMGPIRVDRSGRSSEMAGSQKHINNNNKSVAAAGDRRHNVELDIVPQKAAPKLNSSPTELTRASSTTSSTGFHQIHTRGGVRSMQDSTFKFSGEQIDDQAVNRPGIKVKAPPGGKSTGLW